MTSLKRTLGLNFLVVSTIPVLLFGLLAINRMHDYQAAGINERNQTHALDLGEDVTDLLREVLFDLMLVAEAVSTEHLLNQGQVGDYLQLTVRNSRIFESIYLLNRQRRVIEVGVTPRLLNRQDDYIGLDLSGHSLFIENSDIEGPVWTNSYVSLVTGQPSVTLGVPVPQGFLLGNVNLKSLNQILQRYSSDPEAQFAVIDRDGTLIAHSRPDLALQRMNYNNHPVVIEALGGQPRTVEHSHADASMLESAVPIPVTGWVAWAGLDLAQVLAPIDRLRDLLIGFMVLASVLAGLIALVNVRRLIRPLVELGRQTGQIAAGDYSLTLQPSGYEEIDTLRNQFQAMSHAVRVREESILDSEKRFRNLVNSIEGVVWESDPETGRMLFVSQQVVEMFGFPRHRWLTEDDFRSGLIHPDDRQYVRERYQSFSPAAGTGECEFRMLNAAGELLWVRDLVTAVEASGQPGRLLGVMIDISRQKRLEEELRTREESYRHLVENQSELVVKVDAAGRFLYVSPSFCATFGKTEQELLGQTFLPLVHPDDQVSTKNTMETLLTPPYTCYLEQRAQTMQGWRWLAWSDKAVLGENGQLVEIIGVGRDITDRKAAEEQLARYRTRLEELVAERTRQLEAAQTELVKRERLAVLGKLTATVSHEIRNPLGTIANALYLLREGIEERKIATLERPLNLAERNVVRCDGIISELLDFSRKRQLNPIELDLASWLKELLDELVWPEGVILEAATAPGSLVKADPESLRRAVVNVVDNALQALEAVSERSPVLRVETENRGGQVEIRIIDNGVGIAAADMEKIFEPMFSTKNFGVGLGVPIIKNILEDHGGGVSFQSREGEGTTVTLWLPTIGPRLDEPADSAPTGP